MASLRFLIVLVLAVRTVSFAQFEGEIHMKSTLVEDTNSVTTNIVISVKEKLMAFSVTGEKENEKGMFIYRGDKNLFWIVSEKEKTYLEMPINEPSHKSPKEKSTEKNKANLRRTGKKQSILGYACEEVLVNDEDQEVQIWGTHQLEHVIEGFSRTFGQMRPSSEGAGAHRWEEALIDLKLFPLKEVKKRKGVVVESDEVTGVEAKKVDAARFEAPAGYEKKTFSNDMSPMMKMMQQMGKGKAGTMSREEMEKMMKEYQEQMKNMQADSADNDR